MKTTAEKSGSTLSSNSTDPKATIVHQPMAYGRLPGDMDILERHATSPMPAAFEQIDRTFRAVHSFLDWPSAIV